MTHPFAPHPFTLNFIAMARAAEEIQAMAITTNKGFKGHLECQPGDFWLDIAGQIWAHSEMNYHQRGFWIPRLDQLLGMLAARNGPQFFFLALSTDAVPNWENKDWHELALSVVMKERWGKAWREGKWVKG